MHEVPEELLEAVVEDERAELIAQLRDSDQAEDEQASLLIA